jgi:hypothetical protein
MVKKKYKNLFFSPSFPSSFFDSPFVSECLLFAGKRRRFWAALSSSGASVLLLRLYSPGPFADSWRFPVAALPSAMETVCSHACELEATLNLAVRAIANADHEFGLELCKKASAVIYDPRLCSIMGECYELKGDALEAIAAYRAALTMDTTLSGRPLPTEANQRAQERLQYLVRKVGLGNSWTNVHRQDMPIYPPNTLTRTENFFSLL